MDRAAQLAFVLDHAANPRNRGTLADADVVSAVGSPECGDRVTIYLKVGDDARIAAATFTGDTSTIGRAAASLLTEMVTGRTLDEASVLSHEALVEALGSDIVAVRPRSATLVLDTLQTAIAAYRRRAHAGRSGAIS